MRAPSPARSLSSAGAPARTRSDRSERHVSREIPRLRAAHRRTDVVSVLVAHVGRPDAQVVACPASAEGGPAVTTLTAPATSVRLSDSFFTGSTSQLASHDARGPMALPTTCVPAIQMSLSCVRQYYSLLGQYHLQ